MTRSTLVASLAGMILAAASAGAALAQSPSAQPLSTDGRLDRIDGKLDDILRRLGSVGPNAGQPIPSPAPAPITQPPAPSPGAPETAAYKPGAVAIAHAAPEKPRELQTIPADSIGSFLYAGGPLTLHDLKSKGVRYTGLAGLELQGWLKVTIAGRTQLAVEFRAITGANAVVPPSCIATAWLEDHAIGHQTGEIPVPAREEKTVDLILGAELRPGLYRLKLWTACTPTRDLKLTAEVLTKSPSDMNLRPVTGADLIHQGG